MLVVPFDENSSSDDKTSTHLNCREVFQELFSKHSATPALDISSYKSEKEEKKVRSEVTV
jgi:hypothetical protein